MTLALARFPKPWVFPAHCGYLRQQLRAMLGRYYAPVKFCGVWFWHPNLIMLLPADVLRLLQVYIEPAEMTQLRSTFGRSPTLFLSTSLQPDDMHIVKRLAEMEMHYEDMRRRKRALTRNYI